MSEVLCDTLHVVSQPRLTVLQEDLYTHINYVISRTIQGHPNFLVWKRGKSLPQWLYAAAKDSCKTQTDLTLAQNFRASKWLQNIISSLAPWRLHKIDSY